MGKERVYESSEPAGSEIEGLADTSGQSGFEPPTEPTGTEALPGGGSPPGEAADAGAGEQPSTEQMARLLEDARSKADEHWNRLLRMQAELDNTRKRHERELDSVRKFALERFAQELLQVRDSLELGLSAAQDESVGVEKLREGNELTLKQLESVMEKFGIRVIDPAGERFDPQFHQAMTAQEAEGVEPNMVLSVVQKGYALHDRLIRPAMVIVSR